MKEQNKATHKNHMRFFAALTLAVCFMCCGFQALAEIAENPMGVMVVAEKFVPADAGTYASSMVILQNAPAEDGLCYYNLSMRGMLLDCSGVAIEQLTISSTTASVITVQALDADGQALGEQKTLSAGAVFVMPENSCGFDMKLYGGGSDFRLLPVDYSGFMAEASLSAAENAEVGSFSVSFGGQLRNADGTEPDPARAITAEPVVVKLTDLPAAEAAQPAEDAQPTVEPQPTETPAPTAEPTPALGSIAMSASQLPQGSGVALASVDMQKSAAADANGGFVFESLPAGEYSIYITIPNGMAPSLENWQLTEQGDMIWVSVSLEAGENAVLPSVSFAKSASLDFTAFSDKKATGERPNDYKGIEGVLVEVMDGDNVIASGLTDANGHLALDGIAPGQHVLRVTGHSGYSCTVKGSGSCVQGGNGYTALSDPMDFVSDETVYTGAGFELLGSFSGRVFEDLNNDGLMDENDPGVAGVVLRLESFNGEKVYEITTDETGVYSFGGLTKGTYIFSATLPEGCLYARYSKTGGDLRSVFTGSNLVREFFVGKQEQVGNKNVGVVQNGTMTGIAFLDLNYNGIMEEGEPGYAGVTLEAIKVSNGESYGKTVTDENGAFSLGGLRGGDYRLRAILPDDGSQFTFVPEEGGENANRFVQREGRREYSVEPVNIQSGSVATVPVGVAVGATVRGTVFTDANYDGQYSDGEKRISGVKVYAVNSEGIICDSATTNDEGKYALHDLMPGSYTIKFQRVSGNGFTRLRPNLEEGSYVVELLDGYGQTAPITVEMQQVVEKVNAGMLPSATVSGKLFKDLNDNGLWDKDEGGMTGVMVRMQSKDGETDLLRPVEEDGTYLFDGVMPGTYTVTYQLPAHAEMAKVAQGGNTVEHQGAETSIESFPVVMGEDYTLPLAGAVELGSFEGVAYQDSNSSGARDEGESPISGVTVTLIREDGVEAAAESDGEGLFLVKNLRPGNYTVKVTMADGYIFSRELENLPFAAAAEQTLECPWSLLVSREKLHIGGVQPATVSGAVWLDENKDGTRSGEEALLSGLSMNLVDEATGITVQTIESGENGFAFENVRPGSYTVTFTMPELSETAEDPASGFTLVENVMQQTGITVKEAENHSDLSAGLVARTSLGGTLSLVVGTEVSPVSGVEVSLFEQGGSVALATVVTDEAGVYRFDGLWPGQYQVHTQLPVGMIFVHPEDPNYEKGASIITSWDETSGTSSGIALEMAKHQLNCDIRFIKPGKVGDQAWLDENGNGLIDAGEPALSGVKVTLLSGDQAVYATTTDQNGYFLFDQVYPGTYTLMAQAYPELGLAQQVKGLEIISSSLVSGDGNSALTNEFTVYSGSVNTDYNLGYVLLPGASKPAGISQPETKNWSEQNEKYTHIAEQDWETLEEWNEK